MIYDTELIIRILLIAWPLYITNGSALAFGGGLPVDLNQKFLDKKPILGKGKTFQGTLSGFFFGVLSAISLEILLPQYTGILTPNYALLGSMLAFGAIIGDFVSSFLKRRLSMKQGKEWFIVDQLDFVAGGLLFSSWIYIPKVSEIILIAFLTLILHKFFNWVAFKAKIKNVPW